MKEVRAEEWGWTETRVERDILSTKTSRQAAPVSATLHGAGANTNRLPPDTPSAQRAAALERVGDVRRT